MPLALFFAVPQLVYLVVWLVWRLLHWYELRASHRHEADSTHIAYRAVRASRHHGAVDCVLAAWVTARSPGIASQLSWPRKCSWLAELVRHHALILLDYLRLFRLYPRLIPHIELREEKEKKEEDREVFGIIFLFLYLGPVHTPHPLG
jgi:hypothetical protein